VTALHLAAGGGHVEVARLLLNAGAHALMPGTRTPSPCDLAIEYGHTLVQSLFEPFASDEDVTQFACEGSMLLKAAHEGDLEGVKRLIAEYNLEQEERRERLAGHLSEGARGVYISKEIVARRNFLDTSADNQVTPLMLAARSGHVEVMQLLIEERADITRRSAKGCTAFSMLAGKVASNEALRLRLGANAPPRTYDLENMLMDMIEIDREQRLNVIEENKTLSEHDRLEEVESCVDYADEYGYTPLMLVSGYADAYTMKLLLDAKAVVSKQEWRAPIFAAYGSKR